MGESQSSVGPRLWATDGLQVMTSTSTASLAAQWLAAHQDELITDGNCCNNRLTPLKTKMTKQQCELRQRTYHQWYSGTEGRTSIKYRSPMFMLCRGCPHLVERQRDDKEQPMSRRVRSITVEVTNERIAKAKSKEKPKTKGRSGNDDIFAWRKRRNTKAAWKAKKK